MLFPAIVQAFTTLVLGFVAAYIAWRQWRTSQDRLLLDLFDRRFQVFQELTRSIADAFRNKPVVQIGDIANFDAAREKARFLFGHEVHTYLNIIRTKLIEVYAIENVITDLPEGEARSRALEKITVAIADMNQFYESLAAMLMPYLGKVGKIT